MTARKPSPQLHAGGASPGADKQQDGGNSTDNPALATVSQEVTFLIDNHWISYSVTTEDAKQLSMPPVYKSTSNGKESRMYAAIEPGDPSRPTGTGVITPEPAAFDVDSPALRCLMLAFRGTNPMIAREMPKEYRIFSREESIDDVPCLIIEDATPHQPHKSFWLDPARDFLVLRETDTYNGIERIRRDFTYQKDAVHGWVPSGWRIVNVDAHQKLVESVDASVTAYSINTPLPVEEFNLVFPAGTVVSDATSGGENKRFVVGDPPRKTTGRGLSSRATVLIIGNIAAAAVVMAFRVYRRRRLSSDN